MRPCVGLRRSPADGSRYEPEPTVSSDVTGDVPSYV